MAREKDTAAKRARKAKVKKTLGRISLGIMLVQLVLAILCGLMLWKTGDLSTTQMMIAIIALAIMQAIPLAMQTTSFFRLLAIMASLVMIMVLLQGCIYIGKYDAVPYDAIVRCVKDLINKVLH